MVRRTFWAAVFLICIAVSAASAEMPWPDPSGAVCRVAITRDDAEVRDYPASGSEAVFKASAGAEYIALRHVITNADRSGDGSQWYELLGVLKWVTDGEDKKNVIAPSLEGRSAAGALLDSSLYVSVNDARETQLRDGDAEAVRDLYAREERRWLDDTDYTRGAARLRRAVGAYEARASLEAMSRQDDGATVHRWYDSGDNDYLLSYIITENFLSTSELRGSFTETTFIAANGAELADLVIGSSTEADARALLGAPTYEGTGEIEDGMYSLRSYKLDLSGGVSVHGSEEIERTVSVPAARVLSYQEEESEGVYSYLSICIGEDGTITAIQTVFDNTLVW